MNTGVATTVTIGSDDAREGHDLYRVGSAVVTPGREIVVADQASGTVRIFSFTGDLQAVFGGVGGGPREFRGLHCAWLHGDTIVAYDAISARVSLWDLDGVFLHDVSFKVDNTPTFAGQLHDGRYVVAIPVRSTNPRPNGSLLTDTAHIILLSAAGDPLDTLGAIPYEVRLSRVAPVRSGRLMQMRAPMSSEASLATDGESVVAIGANATQITLFEPASDTPRTIPLPVATREVTQEDINAWVAARTDRAEAGEKQKVRAFMSTMPFPERMPAVDRVLAASGDVYLLRSYLSDTDTASRWFAVNRSGELISEFASPMETVIHHVNGGLIVSVTRDHDDRELVIVEAMPRDRSTQ